MTGNKPMHVAGKLYGLKGAESFRHSLRKSQPHSQEPTTQVELRITTDGHEKVLPFSCKQNAVIHVQQLFLSYMIQNNIELQELLDDFLDKYAEDIANSIEFKLADNTDEKVLATLFYLDDEEMFNLLAVVSQGKLVVKLH